MNEKSLKTLEFNKIIKQVSNEAISKIGKEKALEIKPFVNMQDVVTAQKETTEAVKTILKKGSLPLGGIKYIEDSIKRVIVLGVLSIEELMQIGDFLYVCQKVKIYINEDKKNNNLELLDIKFDTILNLPKLREEINRCIISEQEMADNASEDLFKIRREIKECNGKIKEQLNGIIHSQKYKNMIQENLITVRNDRYCIPIKQEYQHSFQGMVHDQSSTGATVFIEPLVSVQLNNKIKELALQEKKEIHKVLVVLSSLVQEFSESILTNSKVLTELDVIFAKAEYSILINATEPVFNLKGYINIIKGRHPLLNQEKVVPTNIYLGKDFNMLLITGPNTGGKTVSLKTLGLFTLMGQSGLHISAAENSELSMFDDVFADIGDEQSIEQSLSTFSSHMTNIVQIIKKATNKSLILLDELGAGTDPTEGAALAISILEYLREKEIRTAVTTHYSELKVFAISTDKVENASCEFNVETLMPSYKLLIGIPGKSNAFEISKKLGLPDFIINVAKEVLSKEDTKFENVITDLEISKKSVIIEQEKAEQYRKEALGLKLDLENKKEAIIKQKEKIVNEAREEARKILQSAKNDADTLLKQFNKQLKNSEAHKNLEATRRAIGDKLTNANQEVLNNLKTTNTREPITKKLVCGDKVFINSLNQSGTVTTVPDKNGKVMVQAGLLKVKVSIKDLSKDANVKAKEVKKPHRYVHDSKVSQSQSMSMEIDIRGCMAEEGIKKVDKYLDNAYLSGLAKVTIIHGKGTGALRSAIQNYLKNSSHVKSFREGSFGEGDSGVTIAELK
jgi:DNA mismatch repair protein MutS2